MDQQTEFIPNTQTCITGEGYRINEINKVQAAYLEMFKDIKLNAFIGLSYRDQEQRSREAVIKQVYRFIRILNIDMFGNHYSRIVGHSYFSYLFCIEQHKSGFWHAHLLADRELNYRFMIATWWSWAGYITIKQITDLAGSLHYVLKYATKGSDLYPYIASEQAYLMTSKKHRLYNL